MPTLKPIESLASRTCPDTSGALSAFLFGVFILRHVSTNLSDSRIGGIEVLNFAGETTYIRREILKNFEGVDETEKEFLEVHGWDGSTQTANILNRSKRQGPGCS